MSEKGNVSTGDKELDEQIGLWLKWDKNEKSRLAIKGLISDNKYEELKKLLFHRMEFGTAGLRTRMGPGNSQMNDLTIIQTTQGLAAYMKQSQSDVKDRGVVVGFDGRHNSFRWSKIVANIFVKAGIPVYLFSRLCPTPYVAFAVRLYTAGGGVMITASHNPKEDNGYKVYWNNGAQIISPHDKGISQAILDNLEPWEGVWDIDSLKDSDKLVRDPMDEVIQRYNAQVKSLCYLREQNEKCPIRFTYTAMHGVGYEFAKDALKAFKFLEPIPVVEQNRKLDKLQHLGPLLLEISPRGIYMFRVQPDPDFPTVRYPNPEEGEGALKLAMETADKNRSPVIIANDPDADRLAIAEKQESGWRIFTGNETAALMGWWIWTSWRQAHHYENLNDVYLISSTVSSKILETIAAKEGLKFVETLTGFKWMGNVTDNLLKEGKQVLFAFEEAIGFMCGTGVLDKDGLSAAAVLCELTNHVYMSNSTLSRQLDIIYKRYGYHLSSNSYYLCHDADTIKAMFERLRNYDGEGKYPRQCGKYPIAHVRDLTVGYDSETPDKKPLLPTSSSSQMITFKFVNGCVATLRTSGTEPKIKYYVEHRPNPDTGLDFEQAKEQLKEIVDSIGEHFYNLKLFPKIMQRE